MKGKLLFVAGAAVGYVLGARAGRKRYEQIKGAAERVWETPGVQNQVEQVKDFAAQRVGDIPSALADGAQKAFSSIVSSRRNSTRSAPKSTSNAKASASDAPSTTAKPTSKPAAAKSTAAKPAAAKSTTAKPAAKKTGSSTAKKSGSAASTRAKSKPAAESE